MHHNDDGVATRPVCSIELLTTFWAVSKGYCFFLVLAWTETEGLASLIPRDLIVVTTGGRTRTRLDFQGV